MFAVMYNDNGVWIHCYTNGGWSGRFLMPSIYANESDALKELDGWKKDFPENEYKVIAVKAVEQDA